MNTELLKLAESHPQVKKLLEDVAKISDYLKIDIENSNLNEIGAAIETYEEFVKNYENVLWMCTDPDNQQYGRWIAEGHYKFKEKNRNTSDDEHLEEWIEEDIILDLIDDKQKEKAVSGYYDSLKDLKEQCGDSWEWILAECIFEYNSGLY